MVSRSNGYTRILAAAAILNLLSKLSASDKLSGKTGLSGYTVNQSQRLEGAPPAIVPGLSHSTRVGHCIWLEEKQEHPLFPLLHD